MTVHLAPQDFPLPDSKEGYESLSSTFAIASVGITMLRMLETLLPAAAGDVERESQVMADHFTKIIHYLHAQPEEAPPAIRNAITGIIIGMQFQDRNTQIMENVAGMLERYRSMLEDVCKNIEALREGAFEPGHTITQAVDDILSSIRLSDIRKRYLEALAKTKSHLGSDTRETTEPTDTVDIELF